MCSGSAAAQAPDEQWLEIRTEHFHVTHPAGLGLVAARAALRAEDAYEALAVRFGPAPSGTIDLVVTDHTDVSNGFATPFPSNRITVYTRPPVDVFGLQYFDEWLELVITHELVHIFHLDRTNTVGRILRRIFGRVPSTWPLFPEAALPNWAVEGIATYYESELTQAGRVRGTYHDMVLRTAVLEGQFESIDQALGESPVWPLGDRAYVYGSRMLAHMAESAGDTAVAEFVESVRKQWIPYRINSAARNAFGRSFSEAWSDFRAASAGTPPTETTAFEPVGKGGYLELHARPGPLGSVVYARSDGRSETQLRLVGPDGSRRLIRTNGIAVTDWLPDGGLIFHQREFTDPYRLRNDLYRLYPEGRVRRITEGARLSYPSLVPGGALAVAVQETPGGNRLVEVRLADGQLRSLGYEEADALYAFPRVSPNGRWIAVARWLPGAHYDIVILNRAGKVVRTVTDDRAIDQSPTWSADGSWLLFASDRSGISNLYAVEVNPQTADVSPLRQVTNVATGVTQPSVDPEGRWIYASVYHADGWRLERIPFETVEWSTPELPDSRFALSGGPPPDRTATTRLRVEQYSPWRSLRPRYWIPVAGASEEFVGERFMGPWLGFQTSGRDLVGRHAYVATAEFEPEGSRFRGSFAWTYAGLGVPRLGLSAFVDHDATALRLLTSDSIPTDILLVERERGLIGSVRFDRARIRSASQLTLTAGFLQETRQVLDTALSPSTDFVLRDPDSPLLEGGLSVGFANTQRFAYSVSAESGVSLAASARVRREVGLPDSLRSIAGADDGFQDLRGIGRAYLAFPAWGFSRHALALRFAGGVAGGPGADIGHFDVGGAAGRAESLAGVRVGGSALLFPVRGFARDSRFGKYAWSGSVEYRFPIALVHRGLGAWPIYFDRLWGSLFVDMGNAWGPTGSAQAGFQNPRRSTLVSVGSELSVTTLPFWTSRLQVRVGVGIPVQGGSGARAYVRLGNIF